MRLEIINTLAFAAAIIRTEEGILFRVEEGGFNLHIPAVVEELNEIVTSSSNSYDFPVWEHISEEELEKDIETNDVYTVQEWLEYLEAKN